MEMTSHPLLLFVFSFLLLWSVAMAGQFIQRRIRPFKEGESEDFKLVVTAIMTLMGLLIGFTFSMAVERYDQRKLYEEQEANAIGTEYLRADVLPKGTAEIVKALLRDYVSMRLRFYTARDPDELKSLNRDTSLLHEKLWTAVKEPASANPNPVMAQAMVGMNDVINSQGYTQYAWHNRIPTEAWILMMLISFWCNGLAGYGAKRMNSLNLFIVPFAVSVSFLLIADIDSPRSGMIVVRAQDLRILQQSLNGNY
ncbi:MAG: hypothetical protein ACJ763_11615 [Bdellovibrionia bacterium]